MNAFLERNKAMKPTQEKKENLNTSTSKESKLVIRKLPTNKPVPGGFIREFYPSFREELTSILPKHRRGGDISQLNL